MADAQLLDLWERGASGMPLKRSGLLADFAREMGIVAGRAPVHELTVGQRDRAILRLHRALFGPRVAGDAVCAACGERIDVSFTLDGLLGDGPADAVADAEAGVEPTVRVLWDDLVLTCRPLRHGDLVALVRDGRDDLLELARRCVTAIEFATGVDEPSSAALPSEALPSEALMAVAEATAAADPGADLYFDLTCPGCGHGWEETFDPGSFLWVELDRWARRALEDVHRLAAAYGWREGEILALSPTRRAAYLTLVGS